MKSLLLTALALSTFALASCSQKRASSQDMNIEMSAESDESMAEASYEKATEDLPASSLSMAPATAVDFLSTKAADNQYDGNKKFIRTADLRFSVVDALKATHAIEDIVIAKQGFIMNSTLTNEELYSTETRVSRDSIQVQSQVRLTGRLTLSVQHSLLDATLREIAPWAQVVEARTVNAEDVTFRLLANKLEQNRTKDKANRVKNIAGAGKGHHLDDLLSAEETIDNTRAQVDAALVSEAMMYDRIAYSTITISLWQNPTMHISMKPRYEPAVAYKEPLATRVGDGLVSGWDGLLGTVVILFYIWPLVLIVGGTVFLIVYTRKRRKRNRERAEE